MKIKALIFFAIILLFVSATVTEDCKPISNGKYKVVLDEEYSKYTIHDFEITDSIYSILLNGKTYKYKLNRISNCRFNYKRFSHDTIIKDSVTHIEKMINSLGEPYYELFGNNQDTINFCYRRNPHIVIYCGKLIKI